MLVENMEPRAVGIGSLILMPGINKVDDKRWQHIMANGFRKPVDGMINNGLLKVTDAKAKLTIEIVKNTYDIGLLEEWLADPANKGPLKGAIKKQLKEMDLDGLAGE